jgi:hypothetical protein
MEVCYIRIKTLGEYEGDLVNNFIFGIIHIAIYAMCILFMLIVIIFIIMSIIEIMFITYFTLKKNLFK